MKGTRKAGRMIQRGQKGLRTDRTEVHKSKVVMAGWRGGERKREREKRRIGEIKVESGEGQARRRKTK